MVKSILVLKVWFNKLVFVDATTQTDEVGYRLRRIHHLYGLDIDIIVTVIIITIFMFISIITTTTLCPKKVDHPNCKFELWFAQQHLWVWWDVLLGFCLEFTPLSNSEGILKIGKVSTKLSPLAGCPLFWDTVYHRLRNVLFCIILSHTVMVML